MRILLILISIFILTPNVLAEEIQNNKEVVTLIKCDTTENIVVKKDNKTIRLNMIAYDKSDGKLNKEINNYVCEKITNATNIMIEYDEAISGLDKYNRDQVWIYLDDELLQSDLIKKGYGQVNYVQGEYKHLNELCDVQKEAIKEHTGIWNYDGIKEEYCNSGIDLNNVEESTNEDKETDNKEITNTLKEMIFFNSGILLLSLLLVRRVRNGKK